MYTEWPLTFISEEDFTEHVKATIEKYGDKLEPFDVEKFNANIIDPIKMIFDKMVYHSTWEEIVKNEIFRQRDKANNNDIGYFHQHIFKYIEHCDVPANGTKGGWDVIYTNDAGYTIPEGDVVHTIYVEMKNKHNTMNSSSAADTYITMQSQLLDDDDGMCMLVEAIAKHSQNIKWKVTVKGKKVEHKRIRRVSIDKFYAIVTGIDDAFYQMCIVLPDVIEKVLAGSTTLAPVDTVFSEIENKVNTENISMAMAFYLLGFSEYNGFNSVLHKEEQEQE